MNEKENAKVIDELNEVWRLPWVASPSYPQWSAKVGSARVTVGWLTGMWHASVATPRGMGCCVQRTDGQAAVRDVRAWVAGDVESLNACLTWQPPPPPPSPTLVERLTEVWKLPWKEDATGTGVYAVLHDFVITVYPDDGHWVARVVAPSHGGTSGDQFAVKGHDAVTAASQLRLEIENAASLLRSLCQAGQKDAP